MYIPKQNTPSLRFPEFRNDWGLDSVENLLSRVGEPVQVKAEKLYREIGIRSHGKGLFHKGPVDGKSLGNKRVFKVHIPAFVVNIVFAWEHAIALTSEEEEGFIASHRFPMFVPKNYKSDLSFVRYFFLRKYGKHLLGLASPGGAGRNKTLGQKDFARLKVVFPGITEQKKIATFLSSVDMKIEQLSKKRAMLEQYQKGVMRKLLSKELRFNDKQGNAYPDWEEKQLGDFGNIRTSSVDKVSRQNEQDIKLLNYMDVYKRDHIYGDDDFQITTASGSQIESCNLREGDILFTPSSETPIDIGHSAVVMEDLEGVLFSYHLMRFRPNADIILPAFSAYAFKGPKFYKELWKRAQGATRYTLSKAALEEAKIVVPKSFQEQQKIADTLTAIGQKIELVGTQLEKSRIFKKGLLQKMFI